ncbi:MAG TPA: tetratricopeptide repeat protein [Chloroflexia bacterium]|nr:tetratricopeptide repeat protein [Chloroflexia bacterium]
MQASSTSDFSHWLRTRRKALDLTRQELAFRVGCSPTTIEKLEKGERRPSQQIASLLATCLQVPAEAVADFVRFARGGPSSPAFSVVGTENTHLPSPATSFVGRTAEIKTVEELLQTEGVRLVTLLGLAGIGKTRLGLEVAQHMGMSFPGGVYFVPLSSLSAAQDVIPEIARALGVRESSYRALLPSIIARLVERPVLLVLDNFEHLLSSAEGVADLLSSAPLLSVLVTSRNALGVYGEYVFDVPPMSLPRPEETGEYGDQLGRLHEYEAVSLFIQRAKAANPAFQLTEENARTVALLCRRLEGLPLAIELAANRMRVLPPASILAHLGSRLDMLSDGAANLPPRQRSLRGAISWGYDLLQPEAQRLLGWLSVFAGGCSPVVMESMAKAQDVQYMDLLSGLSALVDSSLVRRERGDTDADLRFTMLETVREYAAERLDSMGEKEQAERFLADYFLALAERAEPHLEGSEQASWLKELETEHDNIRASYQYYSRVGDTISAVRLAGALRRFWYLQGYLTEGRTWLASALAHRDQLDAALLAKVLHGLGTLEWAVGRLAAAEAYLGESLAISRTLGDTLGVANMLNNLGIVALAQGDYAGAVAYHDESLSLYRQAGDRWYVALAISNLGLVALDRGDYQEARTLLQESLDIRRELDDRQGIAQSLNNLGIVARCLGDYDEAYRLHNLSLEMFRGLGDRWNEALALSNLAYACLSTGEEGRGAEAVEYFMEGWALFDRLGVGSGSVVCVEGLACVLASEGEGERAAILFGAAERLREGLGVHMASYNRAMYEAARSATVALLGENEFERAWQEGNSMAIERVHTLIASDTMG